LHFLFALLFSLVVPLYVLAGFAADQSRNFSGQPIKPSKHTAWRTKQNRSKRIAPRKEIASVLLDTTQRQRQVMVWITCRFGGYCTLQIEKGQEFPFYGEHNEHIKENFESLERAD